MRRTSSTKLCIGSERCDGDLPVKHNTKLPGVFFDLEDFLDWALPTETLRRQNAKHAPCW